jgi:hypothetical protein
MRPEEEMVRGAEIKVPPMHCLQFMNWVAEAIWGFEEVIFQDLCLLGKV